ncbi:hypothetical protein TNCV_982301 [Trichonephila clavipes]|nr:hypothetical protein TNCV_982301 [Trichonephila clavipes]
MVISGALGLVVSQDYDAPDIISGCTPLHHEQNPYKIQTAPGYYYKADELLRCFNKIRTLQTSFFLSPIRTWTAVRDQESVNQESGLHRNVGESRFNEPYGRQGCVLARTVESNQGNRFDGNESVADSF